MLDIDPAALETFCRRNDIERLRVFGSYARGSARPDSDIDLLVRFSKPKSLIGHMAIEEGLAILLGRRIDLVTESALSPYMRERILEEARDVYPAAA